MSITLLLTTSSTEYIGGRDIERRPWPVRIGAMSELDDRIESTIDGANYGPEFISWWNRLSPQQRELILRRPAKYIETYREVQRGAVRFWLTGELK